MRIKVFRAADMATAITQVRRQLGPEALILSTRRVGDGVEVTAALEPIADPPAQPLAVPAQAAALAWHGVPPALTAQLSAGALTASLSEAIGFGALDGNAPILLAGPPGAGKTLTIAKLATRSVMAGQAPLVVTADGQRAGAPEQLAAYTRLLDLTLVVASTPHALGRAMARRAPGAPMLIDTPGHDPFDPAARDELLALAAVAGASVALVLPAGLDPAEAQDLAFAFREAGATLLVATRLDLCRRLGGIVAAAAAGLTLTEAGIGPGAADGLAPFTPEMLAARLALPPGIRHPRPLQDAA